MSTYNWEQGTVRIPNTDWIALRNAIATAVQAYDDHRVSEATRIQAMLVAAAANEPTTFNWLAGLQRILSTDTRVRDSDGFAPSTAILALVLPYETNRPPGLAGQPHPPVIAANPNPDVIDVGGGQATITLDAPTKTVHWQVHENNHAVRRARTDPIARALFSALSQITYTPGTGGRIVGNDEHNRANRGAGGGGNYLTQSFEPKAPPLSHANPIPRLASKIARDTAAREGWSDSIQISVLLDFIDRQTRNDTAAVDHFERYLDDR